MDPITLHPIGTIHTPFSEPSGMPVQPAGAEEVVGTLEIAPEFAAGLKDLEGFSHLVLLYHFDRAPRTALSVIPFLDDHERGVFATRSPLRPNHLGMSVVELVKIAGTAVTVRGVDILDGTPLLDIKPFVDFLDNRQDTRNGWVKVSREEFARRRSDKRFTR